MERIGSKKIRKGDLVVVCAGNSKGLKGEVIACHDDKVLVRGVNISKKHVKKSKENPQGGVIEIERPIHVSNVCACDAEGKRLKLKVEHLEESGKCLCYTHEGQRVVLRSMKQRKM